jgi:hypothetical protein
MHQLEHILLVKPKLSLQQEMMHMPHPKHMFLHQETEMKLNHLVVLDLEQVLLHHKEVLVLLGLEQALLILKERHMKHMDISMLLDILVLHLGQAAHM